MISSGQMQTGQPGPHQLDVRRQALRKPVIDRSLMTAAHVHHLESARQLQCTKAVKPLPAVVVAMMVGPP